MVALPLREGHRLVRAVALVVRGVGRDVQVADRLPGDLAEDRRGDRAAILRADRVPHRDQDPQTWVRGGQETAERGEVSAGRIMTVLGDLGRTGLTRGAV